MTELAERITVDPQNCGGRPCIRGLRLRVSDVLDLLAAGLSREQVLAELPDLEAEDIDAALRYASARVRDELRAEYRFDYESSRPNRFAPTDSGEKRAKPTG